jgi:carboxylesterase type B
MMTSDSKFFFQRTILQGFGLLFNKELYSQTTKYSQKFAEEIGCGDAPKIKECMKSINTDRLLEVQQEILEDNSVAFGPRIPGDFVDKYPSEAREAFDFQIDFMFGVNSEDDSLFLTTFKNSESEKSESESSEESGNSETDGGDSEDKEEVESREDNEDTTPVERPTMRPLLTAITSAATTTTTPEPKTMTTTPSETTKASKSTTTTTTTAAPTTTTTTTPTTTPKSTTTSTTEASDSSEKEEETDETEKEEKEEDPEAETEAEGGDDEANDDAEEKRRRRKKRETDEYTERLVCPLLKFANTMVESNRSVYIYELMEFSSHHDEIVFAMGYPLKHKNLYDNDELKFSRRVMKNWAQFATNGLVFSLF